MGWKYLQRYESLKVYCSEIIFLNLKILLQVERAQTISICKNEAAKIGWVLPTHFYSKFVEFTFELHQSEWILFENWNEMLIRINFGYKILVYY